MPRVPIAEEHRTGEGESKFPKLKLDKGEYARFVLLEQPWSEWVHQIKAPTIGTDGRAKKVTNNRKDGSSYESYDLEFIGQPLCLGDAGILDDKGVDEKNCPACAAAKEESSLKPVRRYAVNIVRYRLKGATWEPMVPLSLEILIWAFTAKIYDALLDLQNEIGDLRKHDIRLECEDGKYQRNKMMFSLEPAWSKFPGDPQRGLPSGADIVKQAWNEPGNRASDDQLRDACGREVARNLVIEDVNTCLRKWRQATDAGTGMADPTAGAQFGGASQEQDLGAGIDDLLGSVTPNGAEPAAVTAVTEAGSLAEGPGGLGEFGGPDPLANGVAAPMETAPSASSAPVSTPAARPSDEPSFEDLLGETS